MKDLGLAVLIGFFKENDACRPFPFFVFEITVESGVKILGLAF